MVPGMRAFSGERIINPVHGELPDWIRPSRFYPGGHIYALRAERLRVLASDAGTLAPYLVDMAELYTLVHQLDQELGSAGSAERHSPLLEWPMHFAWCVRLRLLQNACMETPGVSPFWREAAQAIRQSDIRLHRRTVLQLLNGGFDGHAGAVELLLLASLNLYGRRAGCVSLFLSSGQHAWPQHCPGCGAAPAVAILRSMAGSQGVRYLHCGFCEGEWRIPRLVCAHCGESGHLAWYHLDANAGIRAEACGACGSYMKQIDQEKLPLAEPLADDLASLALDIQMADRGFARWAVNPLLVLSQVDENSA